ncbi:hypothetical protein DH2020_032479 [Rehmannia glutinosa]|uniref:Uncharacterized protein n=1 Tax=Rehmannia glutinosa TaxID=99300 RepID=A0ABR0VF56_REHGL
MDKLEQQVTSSIKNLETQMGQLAAIVGSQHQKGQFPSNTEVNPREHCNAIHVRNDAQGNMKVKGGTEQQIDKQKRAKKHESYPNSNLLKYNIPLPFPRLFHKTNLNNQFAKFVGMFKKLHINVLFAEAMKHMSNYAKFLGKAMSNKNKWAENGIVNLTEECSALIQRKIPQKLKDPGSFTIPCTIGDIFFDNVLCDLGSSINLMLLSVLRKLGLVEVRPSTVTLQLADRSLVHPMGILEDVLIKVDKFIFPVDFLVLDMNEDCDTPLILGRPFLATTKH